MYFQANEGSFSINPEVHLKALNPSSYSKFSHLRGYSIAWSSIRALGEPFSFFEQERKSLGKKKEIKVFRSKSARDAGSNPAGPIRLRPDCTHMCTISLMLDSAVIFQNLFVVN